MPFTNWLKTLKPFQLEELGKDLIKSISDEHLLDLFEDTIDEIHERGIEEDGYHNYEEDE